MGLDPGLLAAGEDEVGIGLLLGVAQRFADEAGIDPKAFPVRRLPPSEDQPTLYLPLESIRRGLLPPYAGPYPARFALCLRTDDRAAGLTLTQAFAELGFREVTKRAVHEFSQGFVIFYGPAREQPEVIELIRDTLECEMIRQGIVDYPISFLPGSDNDTIEVIAPFQAGRDGTLLRELANPKRFSLTVTGSKPLADDIGRYASELGFTDIKIRHADDFDENAGWLEFGGAPRELVNQLRNGIVERFGKSMLLRARKSWAVTDMKIAITLPRASPGLHAPRRRPWRSFKGICNMVSAADAPPFIDLGATAVRSRSGRAGAVRTRAPDGAGHRRAASVLFGSKNSSDP